MLPWSAAVYGLLYSCLQLCTAIATVVLVDVYLSRGGLKTASPRRHGVCGLAHFPRKLPTQNCLRRGIQLYN